MDRVYYSDVDRSALSIRIRHADEDFYNWRKAIGGSNLSRHPMGYIQKELPVFANEMNLRLRSFPERWHSASTFDLQSLNSMAASTVTLYNKQDQKMVIFVEQNKYIQICKELSLPASSCGVTHPVVQLVDGRSQKAISFQAIELFVRSKAELMDAEVEPLDSIRMDTTKISGRYFLAMREDPK